MVSSRQVPFLMAMACTHTHQELFPRVSSKMATSLVLAPDSSLEEKDTREIFEMAKKMVLEVTHLHLMTL